MNVWDGRFRVSKSRGKRLVEEKRRSTNCQDFHGTIRDMIYKRLNLALPSLHATIVLTRPSRPVAAGLIDAHQHAYIV